jgi:hypothetical protein
MVLYKKIQKFIYILSFLRGEEGADTPMSQDEFVSAHRSKYTYYEQCILKCQFFCKIILDVQTCYVHTQNLVGNEYFVGCVKI